MKLWRGQPDGWKPQPLSLKRQLAVHLTIAAGMLGMAAHAWLANVDPCVKGRAFRCRIAQFWTDLAGIDRAAADASYWLALGLLFLTIAFVSWRHKIR